LPKNMVAVLLNTMGRSLVTQKLWSEEKARPYHFSSICAWGVDILIKINQDWLLFHVEFEVAKRSSASGTNRCLQRELCFFSTLALGQVAVATRPCPQETNLLKTRRAVPCQSQKMASESHDFCISSCSRWSEMMRRTSTIQSQQSQAEA
jgi:hypothetical protein